MFDSLVYIDCCGFICLFILPEVYPPKIYYMFIDGMPFAFFPYRNMMSLLGYNLSYILMKK